MVPLLRGRITEGSHYQGGPITEGSNYWGGPITEVYSEITGMVPLLRRSSYRGAPGGPVPKVVVLLK